MRVAVIGVGNVGTRIVRQLVSNPAIDEIVISDTRPGRVDEVVKAIDDRVEPGGPDGSAIVVIASTAGGHVDIARRALDTGADIVSLADSVDDTRGLRGLDAEAREAGRSVVIGAGLAPGFSDLLAKQAAVGFDRVDEIHVAKAGTGGPACARQHHRALRGDAVDWRDGVFIDRRGRTGRELVFFPEPIGGRDCYRAAIPDALLLAPEFPGVSRVTARMSATRRDRITALLPMMRRPHMDGGPGGIRVELRGYRGDEHVVEVFGAVDHPSVAAAVVASVAVDNVVAGTWGTPGARGLGSVEDPATWLVELHRRGVRAAAFTGST
ncbi:MAG: hypothetical protein GY708_10725 [Actinomycetia bacterium]|nr:hypothetical protein [Actinomycetes bacterium]MCP4960831.1 hypothetical protein [Actinomycetes bacterium]